MASRLTSSHRQHARSSTQDSHLFKAAGILLHISCTDEALPARCQFFRFHGISHGFLNTNYLARWQNSEAWARSCSGAEGENTPSTALSAPTRTPASYIADCLSQQDLPWAQRRRNSKTAPRWRRYKIPTTDLNTHISSRACSVGGSARHCRHAQLSTPLQGLATAGCRSLGCQCLVASRLSSSAQFPGCRL